MFCTYSTSSSKRMGGWPSGVQYCLMCMRCDGFQPQLEEVTCQSGTKAHFVQTRFPLFPWGSIQNIPMIKHDLELER